MWRIFYPLRYFRLINNEKRHIDAWPTIFLAALIAIPYLIAPGASFFRAGGFLDKLITLTAALTGFYVAALVAAATFSQPDLDKTISVGSIALIRKGDDGKKIQELLTRREFATTIFGYLAFSSLLITLFSAVSIPMSVANFKFLSFLHVIPVVGRFIAADWRAFIRGGFIVGFSLAISHLVVATSLGLYYLMDRLYRREARVTEKKHSRAA